MPGKSRAKRTELLLAGFVRARRRNERWLVDLGCLDLGDNRLELGRVAACPRAVDDGVSRAQHAEQRPPSPTIIARARDESRDLDELHEHAADACQRWYGSKCRERIVAGLDLYL